MPTTAQYLTQLQNDRNDLADNLVTMGVAASQSETFTTLVPKVLQIAGGGGGVEITDITLNADGTYTVTDKDNNTHTLTVTETDGQITAITYDGDNVPLTFDSNGYLTGVGDTDIDVDRYPNPEIENIGYYVKFKVDGDDYYVASCQQGESITEPPIPTVTGGYIFSYWETENHTPVVFPYTPNADITLSALFEVNSRFIANSGDLIATIDRRSFYDVGGTNDIVGYCYNGMYSRPIIITKIQRSPVYSAAGNNLTGYDGTVTFNNETYYVYGSDYAMGGNHNDTSGKNRYKATSTVVLDAALEILYAFYNGTE